METTAVAHGGNPQDRAASPRPRCLPKTALHRFFITKKTSKLFSTGCISFLLFEPVVRYGVGYSKAGEEEENQGDTTPNAPYAKFTW
ncbi:MAG: hypothetical protein F6K65_24840 [Moorea sp. SIO3C2]|nr:hypothetical protein [Moorena sp. SIO3C2]